MAVRPGADLRGAASGACNTIIGFNFGDGHLHNEDLIRAIHKKTQEYKVIDAVLGVIERGTWQRVPV